MPGTSKTRKFKAEVKQVLDIVINSLYTNKEIFVRELISNASDALEKFRHISLVEKEVSDPDLKLEIRIETDEKAGTFSIIDTGLGLSEEEANTNLGMIAHSGSSEFLKNLQESGESASDLIGKFGVGFYSAFMVAQKVFVTSKSWQKDVEGILWSSTGDGSYSIKDQEGLQRGTKITLDLKEDEKDFAKTENLKNIIKRYSNFVPFPIFVDGEQINTVQAIWTQSKNDISEDDYKEFYKFIANAHDEPRYTFHFNADAPLQIRSILFVPGSNFEKLNMGRMEPGVSLYCRKVLIQQQVEELLPEYFRFIRGVVDSADLPLNISRETMQDNALVSKLKRVISKRIIKFLDEEAKSDPEKYNKFFLEFGSFIKEGVHSDFELKDSLAKLLRFHSSAISEDELVSLDTYVERMKEGQTAIYYLSGPNREAIEAGPYLEALADRDYEVLYLYEGLDDFVLTSLREYSGKSLISADQADLKLPDLEEKKEESESDENDEKEKVSDKDSGDLARWLKEALGDKVDEVKVSKRLVKSPAVLVNPDEYFTTGMQRIMQMASKEKMSMGKFILEINPQHKILKRLDNLRKDDVNSEFGKEAANMLFDNAMIAAGMLVDPKVLVERSQNILEKALDSFSK